MYIQEREGILKGSFQRVEDLEEFQAFLAEGIAHIRQQSQSQQQSQGHQRTDNTNNPSFTTSTGGHNSDFTTPSNMKRTSSSIGTLEKLINVQYMISILNKSLLTGLKSHQDLFSTQEEDYNK